MDERFGEEDEEMTYEDKMLRRFQKERAVGICAVRLLSVTSESRESVRPG